MRIRATGVPPSLNPLRAYIAESRDGFIALDGGDTAAGMFLHEMESATTRRAIRRECGRSEAEFDNGRISLKFKTLDRLETAVTTVSNTAAAVGRVAETSRLDTTGTSLKDEIFEISRPEPWDLDVLKDFEFQGEGGCRHKFHIADGGGDRLTPINTDTPRAASVNSKYMALSGVEANRIRKFAVHDGDPRRNDIALSRRVATVTGRAEVVGVVAADAARCNPGLIAVSGGRAESEGSDRHSGLANPRRILGSGPR